MVVFFLLLGGSGLAGVSLLGCPVWASWTGFDFNSGDFPFDSFLAWVPVVGLVAAFFLRPFLWRAAPGWRRIYRGLAVGWAGGSLFVWAAAFGGWGVASMAGGVRILYLYAYLAGQGLGHIRSRNLVGALSRRHRVTLRYAVLPDHLFSRAGGGVRRQTMAEGDFLSGGFEVLVIEERLNVRSPEESEKARAETLNQFLEGGGVILFLFKEENAFLGKAENYNAFLRGAGLPAIRRPQSRREFPDPSMADPSIPQLIRGYDEEHALHGGSLFHIEINRKYLDQVAPEVHPAFEGVSRLVVDTPIQLEVPPAKPLLTGNPATTRMLTTRDLWWTGDPHHIPAAYKDRGKGVAATITGAICHDHIDNHYPTDGIQFMLNLVNLFTAHQRKRRRLSLKWQERKVHFSP